MKWDRGEIAKFAASIGLAMLIAGYLRYTIQGELLTASKVILIAGGVLVLASIVVGFGEIIKFFSKRSSQLGTNTGILVLGVIAILIVVNYLGFQHHKRFDLTSEKLYTLSDQTRKIVGGLKQDVDIYHFDKTPDTNLDDVMTEYKNLSPHFHFHNVDPVEKPDVAKQYGATRMGDVVVASGTRKQNLEPSIEGGFAEQDITSAILKVTNDKLQTICFTEGHGEKSLTDEGSNGYSIAGAGLKKEGYLTNSINIVTGNGIPSTCQVIVIPGPTTAFFPQETAEISKYLDAGGKALVMEDPDTNPQLDSILQTWNIDAGKNLVIDASGVGRYFGTGPTYPIVADYGSSPITKNLSRTMTFFPMARTVTIADKTKTDPQSVELLKTSARSFTIPKLEKGQKEISYDARTDTLGPLSLGVAASRETDGKDSRLVVIGNSEFAANPWIEQQKNGDLFYNTIDWLASEEDLISIRPKSAANRRVTLTQGQAAVLKWLDLVFLPAIVIFSGVMIWWKRR